MVATKAVPGNVFTDGKKTETTAKRGKGPISVLFATTEKADFKRVPKGVTKVIIKSRSGETKELDLSQIPTEHLTALAAVAYAAKAKSYVVNHAENDSEVLPLATKLWDGFISGDLYTKATETKTGGKRGKKFDPTDYIEALKRAKEAQAKAGVKNSKGKPVQPATEQELQDLSTQLIAMTGPDRGKKIKKMRENQVFNKYYLAVLAAKINLKKDDIGSIDEMDI